MTNFPPRYMASSPCSSTMSDSSYSSTPSRGKHHQQQQPELSGHRQNRPRLDSISNRSAGRLTPARSKKGSFSSSSGSETPRIKEERFAGARFTLPPSPDAVPLPPLSWFNQSKTIDIKHMLNIDQWEHTQRVIMFGYYVLNPAQTSKFNVGLVPPTTHVIISFLWVSSPLDVAVLKRGHNRLVPFCCSSSFVLM